MLWAASHRRLQMLLQHWCQHSSRQIKTHPHRSASSSQWYPCSSSGRHTRCYRLWAHPKKHTVFTRIFKARYCFGQNIHLSPKLQQWRSKWDSPDNEGSSRCSHILGSDFLKKRFHRIPSLIQQGRIQEIANYFGATEGHGWLNIIRLLFAAHSLSRTHARTCSISTSVKLFVLLEEKCWHLLKQWHLLSAAGLYLRSVSFFQDLLLSCRMTPNLNHSLEASTFLF